MNFLNSTILNWLPLVFIPLIIYLFFKKKLKAVEFSSLYLLKDLIIRQNRRLQIKNILLLIIRTLLVLLLILFFAGLYFGQEMKHFTEKPTRLFIFLDTSPSMQSGNGNFTAQQEAASVVKSLKTAFADAEIKLVTSMKNEEFYLNSSTDLSIIDRIKPAPADKTLQEILSLADQFFLDENQKPDSYNNHLFLLTDGRLGSGDGQFSASLKDNRINRFWVSDFFAKSPEPDFSIDSVKLLVNSGEPEISCYLSTDRITDNSNLLLELFGENGKLSENILEFKENSAVVNISVSSADNDQKAYFKLPEDKNSSNNIYYFKIPGKKRSRIVLAGDSLSYSYQQLVKMSKMPVLQSSYSFSAISFNRLAQIRLEDYDAVVLSALNDLNSYTVSMLNEYLKNGKSLLVLAGSINPAAYNTQVREKLGLPEITGITNSDYNSILPVNYVNNRHPLLKNVFTDGFKLNSVEIYRCFNTGNADNSDEIILSANNQPLLIAGKTETGRSLFLTTSLEKNWSNLAENGLIVPLMINGLNYLTAERATQTIAFTAGQQLNLGQSGLKITTPEDREIVSDNNGDLPEVHSAGFYKYALNNNQTEFFAFNNRRENKKNDSSVDSLFKHDFKNLAVQNTSSIDKIFGRNSKLTSLLIISIFILLALEMWLTKR